MTCDSGGFLTPGLVSVINGRTTPERVLTAEEWNELNGETTD